MRILICVFAVFFLFPSSGRAETGNEFIRRCADSESGFNVGVCAAWPVGFADGMEFSGAICIPSTVENGQIRAVLREYLNRRPSELHLEVSQLAFRAFREAWPCKK